MLDFSSFLPLPIIWGVLIATAVLMYVLLDGFDLGVGILFPFAPSDKCRNKMMNSIAPFWDSNETWLVLGAGGLFVAFPLAYSILLPAFYIPIITMLLGLIMRGVAFEFRFKASAQTKKLWDYVFHGGSLTAAFCQGLILGGFVSGVAVDGRNFAGRPFDWLTSFSMLTGLAMVAGYGLLGATWLVLKTDKETESWARRVASYLLAFVGISMALVSISMPVIHNRIAALWFSLPNLFLLSPIPILTALLFLLIWRDLHGKKPHSSRPFFSSMGVFFLGYVGLGISIFPYIVPYHYSFNDAAASGRGLSLMLIGVIPLLPIILAYTGFSYYIFRGKTHHGDSY
ncbi:MAG: cytochrome d ubiquinol oxidase subunit II [Alphaproteobacteria bacterium]|nr:cytochrome d ubiquinol oxidase subunit II [Alphaproteobacteria bacterium]